jgi:hypothetical protein
MDNIRRDFRRTIVAICNLAELLIYQQNIRNWNLYWQKRDSPIEAETKIWTGQNFYATEVK